MIGIRELAQHLNISIGTVSRALNGKADVNAETRRRVIEAAATLGYTPNQSGRSLRAGTTGLLGVLIPSVPEQALLDSVFASVLDGLRRFVATHGFDLGIFLYSVQEDPYAAFRRVAERRVVDGLIIAETLETDPRIDYLVQRAIPFVAFGRSRSTLDHCWVDLDFAGAVDQSVDRLVTFGHQRIALVVSEGELNFVGITINRLREALSRHGLTLPEPSIIRQRPGEAGGYAAGDALLALDPRPTAVLCTDRHLAIGLYKRLNEAGLEPGRDIALIGLHSDERAQFLSPALSYFQCDLDAVGQELGRAMLAALKHPTAAGEIPGLVQSVVKMTFIAGESDVLPLPQ